MSLSQEPSVDRSRVAVTHMTPRYKQTKNRQAQSGIAYEDRYLRTLHLRNHFLAVTSSAMNVLGHRINRQTVARRLKAHGMTGCHVSAYERQTPYSQNRKRFP